MGKRVPELEKRQKECICCVCGSKFIAAKSTAKYCPAHITWRKRRKKSSPKSASAKNAKNDDTDSGVNAKVVFFGKCTGLAPCTSRLIVMDDGSIEHVPVRWMLYNSKTGEYFY